MWFSCEPTITGDAKRQPFLHRISDFTANPRSVLSDLDHPDWPNLSRLSQINNQFGPCICGVRCTLGAMRVCGPPMRSAVGKQLNVGNHPIKPSQRNVPMNRLNFIAHLLSGRSCPIANHFRQASIRKTLGVVTVCVAMSSTSASAALLVGWDTFTNPDNGTVNNATSNLAGFSGGAVTDNNTWGQSGTANSSDTTFGTLAGASGAGSGLSLNNGAVGFVDFTVTNSTGCDYDLDFFHFDAGTTRPGAADAWTLSIESGPLTLGAVTNGVSPNGGSATPAWTDYDLALTGLADNTLETGQTAVIRLTFALDSMQGPAGHHQYTDNIALSGTKVVPEPASLALLLCSLAALGLIRRRR